jgi:hypothetical protein
MARACIDAIALVLPGSNVISLPGGIGIELRPERRQSAGRGIN